MPRKYQSYRSNRSSLTAIGNFPPRGWLGCLLASTVVFVGGCQSSQLANLVNRGNAGAAGQAVSDQNAAPAAVAQAAVAQSTFTQPTMPQPTTVARPVVAPPAVSQTVAGRTAGPVALTAAQEGEVLPPAVRLAPEIEGAPDSAATTGTPPGEAGDASGNSAANGGNNGANDDTADGAAEGATGRGREPVRSVTPLALEDVVLSTRVTFPAIREALALRDETGGNVIAALGSFDDVLEGHTLNQPLGFYENYRHGVALKRPLVSGGYMYGGYRLGDGNFEPWYTERETNAGGEFKLGFDIPLLQNRAIDKRRAELQMARLRRGQAEPEILREVLDVQAAAVDAYWQWVAAGRNVEIQQALLDLGLLRGELIEAQFASDDVALFTRIDNQRLVAGRRIKLIEAERKFGEAAVKLSLYLRSPTGVQVLPDPFALPGSFPELQITELNSEQIISAAVSGRPEVQSLQFDASVLRVELEQALNQLLPELNLAMEVSQDVGEPTSSKRDKSEAILATGVYGSVPVQRRFARGKAASLRAKLAQVDAKLQLTQDKIANQVRQILITRAAAIDKIDQADENLDLAEKALELAVVAERQGEFTLPVLNIYEESVAGARLELVNAQAEYWTQVALLVLAQGNEL